MKEKLKNRVILNIGLHFSANSILEKEFLNHDMILISKNINSDIFNFFKENILFYKFGVKNVKKNLKVYNFFKKNKEKTIVFSSPIFFGDFFLNLINNDLIINNFCSIFESINIIMIIQKQLNFIKSFYLHSLENGYWKTFKEFICYSDGELKFYEYENFYLNMNNLKWNLFLDNYSKKRGVENLKVFYGDNFFDNKLIDISITDEISIKINNKTEEKKIYINKFRILLIIFCNRIFKNKMNAFAFFSIPELLKKIIYNFDSLEKKYILQIEKKIERNIDDFYYQDNIKLEDKIRNNDYLCNYEK